jgi:hypothetical protein
VEHHRLRAFRPAISQVRPLTPTIGLIDRQTALDHYKTLDALGFSAAGLQLDDSPLDANIIQEFRSRYSKCDRAGTPNGNGPDSSVSQP